MYLLLRVLYCQHNYFFSMSTTHHSSMLLNGFLRVGEFLNGFLKVREFLNGFLKVFVEVLRWDLKVTFKKDLESLKVEGTSFFMNG